MGPKGVRIVSGEGSTMRNFKVCTVHVIYLFRVITSRRLRWAGHVPKMEEGRGVFKMLTGKPTLKRPIVRPRRRRGDDITMELIGGLG